MATHSSILAWRIPWTEEPGRLQSMGSQRVRQETEQLHLHLVFKGLYNNSISCLKAVSGLNLLANSVILKCKLMGVDLVRTLRPPDILWIHWRVYNSIANTSKGVLFLPASDVYVRRTATVR